MIGSDSFSFSDIYPFSKKNEKEFPAQVKVFLLVTVFFSFDDTQELSLRSGIAETPAVVIRPLDM